MKAITVKWILSLFVVLFLGRAGAAAQMPEAPPFELRSLDGKVFTQDDLQGQVTLIVFWASWCHTCQEELPKIRKLQEKLKGKKFQVLAVGFKDSEARIRQYVAENRATFPFPVLYDVGNRVAGRFGANVTPTLVVVNPEGMVGVRYPGPGLLEDPRFQELVKGLSG